MKRIALLLFLLAGCGPKPVAMVLKGASATFNGVEFSGGHCYFPGRDGGVCFGTIRRLGGPVEVAYAIFLRTAGLKLPQEALNDMRGDGTTMDGTYVMTLGEFELRVKHTVGRDSEGLEVNGQRIDLSRGRAFLIDLTSAGSALAPIAASLPSGFPAVDKDVDVAARGRELMDLTW